MTPDEKIRKKIDSLMEQQKALGRIPFEGITREQLNELCRVVVFAMEEKFQRIPEGK